MIDTVKLINRKNSILTNDKKQTTQNDETSSDEGTTSRKSQIDFQNQADIE